MSPLNASNIMSDKNTTEVRIIPFHGNLSKKTYKWLEEHCIVTGTSYTHDIYTFKSDLHAFIDVWKEKFLCYPTENGGWDIFITDHSNFSQR